MKAMIIPQRWNGDHLLMLDQRILPTREEWIPLHTHAEVARAIRDMVVRGAPAIGVSAAYGMALAAKNGADRAEATKILAASRPTAVNLFWALDRIGAMSTFAYDAVLEEAKAIENEDLFMNRAIGLAGKAIIPKGANVLTICNTGGLATSGLGTALGVIRAAYADDPSLHVYTCETRPRQQGLRLTAYELQKDGIPFHSIADGVAASLMRARKVDVVIAGADRIAANGDTANKIGTYALAVQANHHGIPFYIAAPSSTLDPSLKTGDEIPIEERAAEELTHSEGIAIGPEGCHVYNPAFDVTPGELITGIITERGIARPPYRI